MTGGTAPDQHRLGHAPAAAILGHIPRDFAAAGGVADMDGALQVQRGGQFGHIGGVGVHFIAVRRLGRAAVPAPVMGDDPVALGQEEQHLVVPVVGAERPAMVEDQGLARPPILEEDLGPVLGGDGGHRSVLPLAAGETVGAGRSAGKSRPAFRARSLL
jgi:hypothetical protein